MLVTYLSNETSIVLTLLFPNAQIVEVLNKTLAFHTSVNYQIHAPAPFDLDVHEDLVADLARISEQTYSSEFAFHIDIYRSFKRVNDGHCGVYNYCYDCEQPTTWFDSRLGSHLVSSAFYVTYIPLPLVLLTASDGSQNVHIAPEAFEVASREYKDDIEFWQQALPGHLKGQLASVCIAPPLPPVVYTLANLRPFQLSGARVLHINGADPFVAVNESAKITGSYQAFGTRQNSYEYSFA
jgi:hypothetical protein